MNSEYYLLGKSGLRISRIALGTMTFGTDRDGGWGTSVADSRAIFDRFIAAGGNFLDCADYYGQGLCEEVLGRFIADSGLRDRVVLATKFNHNLSPGDPNAGGNGRKNILRAVDQSLRRLGTDYIDLYLLHMWDCLTPPEEVARTFDDLIRAGKIRYAGLSDVPAWYAARVWSLSEAHGLGMPINLQLPYSLVERQLEHEYIGLARTLGMGITAWAPLASGLLSGKYAHDAGGGMKGQGRLTNESMARLGMFNERNARIVAALESVALALNRSMAQVALNWTATQPAIAAIIIGATKLSQIEDNLGALSFTIPAELRARLDAASALEPVYPYKMFGSHYQGWLTTGGATVGDKPSSYAPPLLISGGPIERHPDPG